MPFMDVFFRFLVQNASPKGVHLYYFFVPRTVFLATWLSDPRLGHPLNELDAIFDDQNVVFASILMLAGPRFIKIHPNIDT